MSSQQLPIEEYGRKRRTVLQLVKGVETSDGAGVKLRRFIASPELPILDPFLLLDFFSSDNPDDYIAGFPPHPHRGFETVTYMLAGRMRHQDSAGHNGLLQAGGVQWMTAGRGIEHSEIPEQENGLLQGFQLWVNLPACRKMVLPYYQEFAAEQIPTEQRENGTELKVIAGLTDLGLEGVVKGIDAEPKYFDVSLHGNSDFHEAIPAGHNAFIYVIEGDVAILDEHQRSTIVTATKLATLTDGDELALVSITDKSRFLLIAGKPFGEPVARGGPFVMNSREEIVQAYRDYQEGRFGFVDNQH